MDLELCYWVAGLVGIVDHRAFSNYDNWKRGACLSAYPLNLSW